MKKLLSTFLTAVVLSLSVPSSAQAAWDKSSLENIVQGMDVFWTAFLSVGAVDYQPPTVYAYAGADATPCGPLLVANYCFSTNTVYLDVVAMNNLANSIGDAAAYVVIAHEYSHSVQYQLGLYSSGASVTALELQADCLAGTFFAGADYAGLLEPDDFNEGFVSTYMAGDFDTKNSNHHGTPNQRATAFARGFYNPNYCFEGT